MKYIYSFDSRNPNITTLAKRTDSVRLLNSELNWFRPSKTLSKVKDSPIVDASVLICDKKSKKSLFTFKTLDGEIIKIGSEKIEQKNYENCERLIFNFIYYVSFRYRRPSLSFVLSADQTHQLIDDRYTDCTRMHMTSVCAQIWPAFKITDSSLVAQQLMSH